MLVRKKRLTLLALLALAVIASFGLIFAFGCPAGMLPTTVAAEDGIARIRLPGGFKAALFSKDVPGARSLALGIKGTVFVGTRDPGKVYAVIDADADGKAEKVLTLAAGMNSPNGVVFHKGDLIVAEISRITRLADIENHLKSPPKPVVIYDQLPGEEQHGWKFIGVSPDDRLYIPIGAPCNVCLSKDPRFASIARLSTDFDELEVFASGVRNTVGFDWNPRTGVLWFTDNGRDWMGDDRPPDELNRAPKAGIHFGFPFCHGTDVADPDFDTRSCEEFASPVVELGPHVAALGMRFYEGEMFPPKYRGGIFIAEHGSWNRTTPIGYRVVFVPVENENAKKPEMFATGWLDGSSAWGRPVDVLVMPDGALLVSDDKAGAIYRISYHN